MVGIFIANTRGARNCLRATFVPLAMLVVLHDIRELKYHASYGLRCVYHVTRQRTREIAA